MKVHAFTVDLEEWFCTHNFNGVVHYDQWDSLESRIEHQMNILLSLLGKYHVKATFFVLGWVADRFPALIRHLASEGHEIGSHGYSHKLTWEHGPTEFLSDLHKASSAIKTIVGDAPGAFRAPAFSIVEKTRWAVDALVEAGFTIDSSVYPVSVHPEYGMANSPLLPYPLAGTLTEIPMSCIHFLNTRIPMSGGAYFRLTPYLVYKKLVKRLEKEGRTLNFYIHPWEVDPHIPRIKNLPLQRRWRHYTGLGTVEKKLDRLLNDFSFGTLTQAFKLS